jgi:hypothetical protein
VTSASRESGRWPAYANCYEQCGVHASQLAQRVLDHHWPDTHSFPFIVGESTLQSCLESREGGSDIRFALQLSTPETLEALQTSHVQFLDEVSHKFDREKGSLIRRRDLWYGILRYTFMYGPVTGLGERHANDGE